MLIIVYLFEITSDIKSKQEHTPFVPSQEGNWNCGIK